MKKLNRKGFTLIELLAVIVILAVVMGIAVNTVLNSMNKARGGATFDTAQVVANGFLQKYTESLVNGAPSDVYGDILGANAGYNFTTSGVWELASGLADTFNISAQTYTLGGTSALTTGESATATNKSFVAFNATTGKFTVCMAIPNNSANYVSGYALTADTLVSAFAKQGTSNDIKSVKVASGVMMACSDSSQTWN